ncbi:MAG: aldo/keto reductase [Deinococcales bacterium]
MKALQAELKELSKEEGRSLAQLALGFVLNEPVVATVAAGGSSLAQLEDNVATMSVSPLDARAMEVLRGSSPPSLYQDHRLTPQDDEFNDT